MTAEVILNDTSLTARDGREEQDLVARGQRRVPVFELVVDRDLAARHRVRETMTTRKLAIKIGGRSRLRADALGVAPRALAERREIPRRDFDRHAVVSPGAT